MLVDGYSVITGFKLIPLMLAGTTVPLLAMVPYKIFEYLNPPELPETMAPPANPLMGAIITLAFAAVFHVIPWHYWSKYRRIKSGEAAGPLFDERLSLSAEVVLGWITYLLPAVALGVVLIFTASS